MTQMTRRGLIAALGASSVLAGCANGVGGNGAARIDARVDATLNQLYSQYPNSRSLNDKSVGMLVMPLITEAGLGFGAGYGRGALRVNGVTVDYYSAAKASAGLQIGAQQYSHVLFFMTEDALYDFRRAPGWAAGGDVEYAIPSEGQTLRAETTTSLAPVVAVIFGQAGLRVGATLKGTKYSRIIP